MTEVLWDQKVHTSANSSNTECLVGVSFRPNNIALIYSVRYFLSKNYNKTNFAKKLKFEGSQNNATWEILYEFGYEIHEGWN